MKTTFLKPATKKTKQFLFFLPIVSVPFLTLIFWLMGGGKGSELMAKTSADKHLLTSLPAVDLSAQKEMDKMSYYEKATADSIKDKDADHESSFWDKTYLQAREIGESNETDFDNSYNAEHQEAELHKKLDRLNEVLNSSESEQNHAVKQNAPYQENQLDETQHNLNSIGKEADPELEQLNGMLEKIWNIQHPEADEISNSNKDLDNLYRAIPAVIEGKQKIGQGSVVKLRLLESVELNNQIVPKDHLVFGICRITNQRLQLDITNIRLGKSILPVDLSTYDMTDGMEGINVPDALLNDAMRTGSDDAVQSLQFLPYDQNMETQIASAGISAAKGLFSKRSRRIRVKLKDGYKVLLKNNRK
nr:conjugative transposon protein TraM [uncultured Pedobacter sp.]